MNTNLLKIICIVLAVVLLVPTIALLVNAPEANTDTEAPNENKNPMERRDPKNSPKPKPTNNGKNQPPTVMIITPDNGDLVSSSISIQGIATDDGSIAWVKVSIDGGSGLEATYNSGTESWSFSWDTTTVDDGLHTITAKAKDDRKRSSSHTINVNVDNGGSSDPNDPGAVEKYALIIGLSHYQSITNLQHSDEDATEWYNYFTDLYYQQIWVYGDSQAKNFPQYDGLATKDNMIAAIQDIASIADGNDEIAIVFLGHGYYEDEDTQYICCYDSNPYNCDGDLADSVFAAILSPTKAAQVFIFLDACHGGGFIPEIEGANIAGEVYFTATATADGYGWDCGQPINHGAWTNFFLIWGLKDPEHKDWGLAYCHDQASAAYYNYYMEEIDGTGGKWEDWDWDGPMSYDHPEDWTNSASVFYL